VSPPGQAVEGWSLDNAATELMNIIQKYLSLAEDCIQKFKNSHAVLIEIANSEDIVLDTVLACIIQVTCDEFFWTIDGFMELLYREWNNLQTSNLWMHYLILLLVFMN
jgi:hypothetical protein